MTEPIQSIALVVDDDDRSLELMRVILGREGYRVLTALDGTAALDLLRTQRPSLIFVDIRLPGMDGLELCRRIRRSDGAATATIAVVSGMDDQESRRAAVDAGADLFMTKPVDLHDLRATLGRLRREGSLHAP